MTTAGEGDKGILGKKGLLESFAANGTGKWTTEHGDDIQITRRKREVGVEATDNVNDRGGSSRAQRLASASKPAPAARCRLGYDGQEESRLLRPTPHVFSPFWPRTDINHDTTNRDVQATMSKPLSSDELRAAAAGGGYVYLFCLPGREAVSPPTCHVKIGMTTRSVACRMRRIANACRYEPMVMRSVLTRYPLRVERLCHAQLRGQRRRELPGCPGCGRAHREWFEVSPPEAERVVCFWSEWLEHTDPYSETTGELRAQWRGRLGEVHLDNDPDRCWSGFSVRFGVMTKAVKVANMSMD